MAETWLVTGASGFLGRHVLAALEGRTEVGRVLTVDRRQPALPDGLVADLAAAAPDLRGALGSGEVPEGALQRLDVVVHLAGLAHRPADTATHHRVHVEGLRNLLVAVDSLAEPPRSVVFASSIAVYGRTVGELLDEETPLIPTTAYGAAKAEAEELLGDWAETRATEVAILRLPLLVGRDAPGNLGRMIDALARHRYLGVGPGTARRSMALAEDVAAVLPRASRASGIYQLTDRRHPSFRELEEVVCAALGRGLPPRLPSAVARALGLAGDLATRVSRPLGGRIAPFTSDTFEHMTSTLTFSDDRAVRELGWSPHAVLERTDRWIGVSSC